MVCPVSSPHEEDISRNVFTGMYTCLFLGSSYLLMWVSAFQESFLVAKYSLGRFKREKAKVVIVMVVLNTIMWFMSTTHVTITIIKIHWVYLRGTEHGGDTMVLEGNNTPPGLYSLLALECVNVRRNSRNHNRTDFWFTISPSDSFLLGTESCCGGHGYSVTVANGYSGCLRSWV